jgi:hypothetical protein
LPHRGQGRASWFGKVVATSALVNVTLMRRGYHIRFLFASHASAGKASKMIRFYRATTGREETLHPKLQTGTASSVESETKGNIHG